MDSDRILKEMMEKKVWAVVGVTAKKERFGYKIWKILQKHGYEVYGVNPNYDEIEGQKIYKSLKNLPKKVDVIDMVVSPKIGTNTLDEAKELGIDNIFFQPGTYNDEILKKSEDLGFIYVIDCVYAILRQRE
ncbi:MAG TPA: CoA-binding protein [Tissierellaceae bacterium]|nr:CoA-binding protein [Tissierellaceae bacterium]